MIFFQSKENPSGNIASNRYLRILNVMNDAIKIILMLIFILSIQNAAAQVSMQNFTAVNSSNISTFSPPLTNYSSMTANITDYATQSNPYAINTTGLVGWWHMDETTGTLIEDNSSSRNNGTWNGNTTLNTTTGKYNASLAFDGTNDNVSIPHNTSLKPPLPVTISAWIYPTDTSQNVIFASDGAEVNYRGYNILINTVSQITYGDNTGGGALNRRSKTGNISIIHDFRLFHFLC